MAIDRNGVETDETSRRRTQPGHGPTDRSPTASVSSGG